MFAMLTRGRLALALCGGLLGLLMPATPAQEPLGPQTTNAGPKVVIVQDARATEAFRPRPAIVRAMVDCAMTNLTGKSTCREAWLSIVSTQDIVGIKVFSHPGPNSGTRPAVAAAVVEGLLAAGLPPAHVVIWDRQSVDLRLAGYYDLAERYGIRVAASVQTGFDEKTFYESAAIGNLVWGDVDFGKKGERIGRRSYVTKLVTDQFTKIINITPLLNHNLIGVSGNLYSLALGSVDNVLRFESSAERLAIAAPEICALPVLRYRVPLSIVDGLLCQYEGGEQSLLHYSTMLNQIRVSRDPVALDALSIQELNRQRDLIHAFNPKPDLDLYQNAALLELGVSDTSKIRIQKLSLP